MSPESPSVNSDGTSFGCEIRKPCGTLALDPPRRTKTASLKCKWGRRRLEVSMPRVWGWGFNFGFTYSLHCSSFLGLAFRILNIDLVKPKNGTTMETI